MWGIFGVCAHMKKIIVLVIQLVSVDSAPILVPQIHTFLCKVLRSRECLHLQFHQLKCKTSVADGIAGEDEWTMLLSKEMEPSGTILEWLCINKTNMLDNKVVGFLLKIPANAQARFWDFWGWGVIYIYISLLKSPHKDSWRKTHEITRFSLAFHQATTTHQLGLACSLAGNGPQQLVGGSGEKPSKIWAGKVSRKLEKLWETMGN